jgi:hypothetical protein
MDMMRPLYRKRPAMLDGKHYYEAFPDEKPMLSSLQALLASLERLEEEFRKYIEQPAEGHTRGSPERARPGLRASGASDCRINHVACLYHAKGALDEPLADWVAPHPPTPPLSGHKSNPGTPPTPPVAGFRCWACRFVTGEICHWAVGRRVA